VKRTLEKLGVSRSKSCRWYDLDRRFGAFGLEDRSSRPQCSDDGQLDLYRVARLLLTTDVTKELIGVMDDP